MPRDTHVWINVSDGKSAIGVWANKELVKSINYKGNYKTKGDMIEVIGRFNKNCLEHGGDLDIHAQKIIKRYSGHKVIHKVSNWSTYLAIFLFFIMILVKRIKNITLRKS